VPAAQPGLPRQGGIDERDVGRRREDDVADPTEHRSRRRRPEPTLVDDLLAVRNDVAVANDVRIQFSCCEPHLLSLYLLERPRSFDVDAAAEGTRILSLSERALRTMIAEDATVAAKLLLNLSKMLCVRLVRAS